MRQPRLTFACELDTPRLTELFADASVMVELQALRARVALMLSDYSAERAQVIQQLNQAGVPVVAIPLVAAEDGYYFTADNPPQAEQSYERWKEWTAQHGLVWDGVGLDIEPEGNLFQQLIDNPWRLPAMVLPRLADTQRPRRARRAYTELVDRIRGDGWAVENYQFPLIADERRAGSTLLQRLLGIVDVATDREVWMLYNSFLRTLGPGLLWSYGPEATGIAVGTTGGGPDVPGHPQMPSLSWEELTRDLRLARQWSDDLYIHSLEGCVWQGFLPRLRSVSWSEPVTPPRQAWVAVGLRRGLRGTLWASAHPWPLAGLAVLALTSGLAVLAAKRVDRRARVGHAA